MLVRVQSWAPNEEASPLRGLCWDARFCVLKLYAEVVKLVDTHVSGACGASYAGSSPAFGTNLYKGRKILRPHRVLRLYIAPACFISSLTVESPLAAEARYVLNDRLEPL